MSRHAIRGLAARLRTPLVIAVLTVLACGALPRLALAEPVTITNYTDQAEQLGWGQRSHWKQPWRSYIDTVPGSTLRNAVGINFNVTPQAAASTARLLRETGFHRARIEVGWGNIDYSNPNRLSETGLKNLEADLVPMRENGIRPLILLNANEGLPCPVQRVTLHLTAPAAAGATEIHLSPGDVGAVVPGKTGLKGKSKAAFQLIESVTPDGTAQMSKPLLTSYPAGELKAETLLYEPFSSPLLLSGSPNPRFEATLDGWLEYVGVVTREAKRILGSGAFDVEIWNELSFGSAFLNIDHYYEPALEPMNGSVTRQILYRTIAYLRNPAHGVPDVGIGNGFANQQPWPNGTESPLGLSAIDKHPYAGWEHYPADAQVNGNRPLNGLGEPAGWLDAKAQYHEDFTPEYDAFFPERFISGLHTETLIHDLSPYPTNIANVAHGRYTHAEGGSPPTMWITEVNMDPATGPTPATQMSQADIRHVETKEVLRYLTAFVNKGVTALDLYAASAGNMSVVGKSFLQAANASPTVYPGREEGGETVEAVRRLTDAMKGFRITQPANVELRSLTDYESNTQFEGDPADPQHYPPLYNRDVLAFLPFQTSNSRFVIPVYVMTRNVVENYRPDLPTDPSRFDLPQEPYRLQIGGVDGRGATVTASDPISGLSTPVSVVSAGEDEIVVDMQVSDSPRLLTIEEEAEPAALEPEAGDGVPIGAGEAPPESAEPPAGLPEEEAEEAAEEEVEEGPGHGELEGPTETPEPPEEPISLGSQPPDSPRDRSDASPAAAAGEETSAGGTASIELHHPRALLASRQMEVSGHCSPDCRLRIVGRLSTGNGRPYRMFQSPRHSPPASSSPTLTLGISERAARIARDAFRHGKPLKIVVSGRAKYDGGRSRNVAEGIYCAAIPTTTGNPGRRARESGASPRRAPRSRPREDRRQPPACRPFPR